MTHFFEFSVKINDQKFDICIKENENLKAFKDIYPKLKEVVKIGANEDIDFQTHDFELFERTLSGHTSNCIHIRSFNSIIRHQSLISIETKPKEVINKSNGRPIPETTSREKTQVLDRNSDLRHETRVDRNNNNTKPNSKSKPLPDIPYLISHRKDVQDFHRIVLAINIGWNFRTDNPLIVWRKVSDDLRSKTILISAESCCSLFNTWTNFYAKNYDFFEGKISGNSQQLFDLLKVVHTLELRQLLRETNQTRIKIERISKTGLSKEYFRKHLLHIYERKCREKEVVSLLGTPLEVYTNYFSVQKRMFSLNEVRSSRDDSTSKSRPTKKMRQNDFTANPLPKRDTSLPKKRNISLFDYVRGNHSNKGQTNNCLDVRKKVISYSDYKKLKTKSDTKSGESLPSNDCNSLNSVKQMIAKECVNQMIPNSDPRLRFGRRKP